MLAVCHTIDAVLLRLFFGLLFFFCFVCFYQDVNTRGHHSMMCTLWMGWQVIDSMEMGRRGEQVGEGEGE